MLTAKQNIEKNSTSEWKYRAVDSIVEIESGLLVGLYDNSPNAMVVGFAKAEDLANQFIRQYLGRKLPYNSFQQRDFFLEKHKTILGKTFDVIGEKKQKPKEDGRPNPSPGILIGGERSRRSEDVYFRIVGFVYPDYTAAYYKKLKEIYLASSQEDDYDEDEGKKNYWPDDYWKKFGLKDNPYEKSSWTGTEMNHDDISMKLHSEKGLVKEFLLRKRFRQ
jgi:hypothetical protein